MPIYNFQCECGLQFEQSRSFAKRDNPVKCKACGEKVERSMPTEVAGVFRQQTTSMNPQNTGVSSFDHHVDRVVGKSADEGRAFQDHRASVKRAVLRSNPGATRQDLTELPDGTWDVMAPEVKTQQAAGRIINNAAMRLGRYQNNDTYHLDEQGRPSDNPVMSGQKRRKRARSLPSDPQG